MEADEQKRKVRLPDGRVIEIGGHRLTAISSLSQAIMDVAYGVTRGLTLVEVDESENTRRTIVVIEPVGLDKMADALDAQSKMVRQAAASWEGNAPPASRSLLQH